MKSAENQDPRPVAFFDFDGTLTTGDTLMPFLKYVVGSPKYYAKLALVSPILLAYFAKIIRNDMAKQIILRQYLFGYHIDELFELGQKFSEEIIPDMLRHEGMERLRWHQNQGHVCVLVSASLDVYLTSWARNEHFTEAICTSLKVDKHHVVSGKLDGENCHGKVKVSRVKSFLETKTLGRTFGYGDTSGDLPLLNYLNEGMMLSASKGKCYWRKV